MNTVLLIVWQKQNLCSRQYYRWYDQKTKVNLRQYFYFFFFFTVTATWVKFAASGWSNQVSAGFLWICAFVLVFLALRGSVSNSVCQIAWEHERNLSNYVFAWGRFAMKQASFCAYWHSNTLKWVSIQPAPWRIFKFESSLRTANNAFGAVSTDFLVKSWMISITSKQINYNCIKHIFDWRICEFHSMNMLEHCSVAVLSIYFICLKKRVQKRTELHRWRATQGRTHRAVNVGLRPDRVVLLVNHLGPT